MSIKITCDICGKEIHGFSDGGKFDHFDVCDECFKKMEKLEDKWKEEKRLLFANFIAVNLKKPAKKEKPAPHTHVCKCKGGKPVAAVCKGHEQKVRKKAENGSGRLLVTMKELAAELKCNVHSLQCYALRHKLGILNEKTRMKMFNAEEAEKVRRHFSRGGK